MSFFFFSQVIQVASLSDQTLEVTAEEIQRLEGNENWGCGENKELTIWLKYSPCAIVLTGTRDFDVSICN